MTIQSLSTPQPNPNLGFVTYQKHTEMNHMSEIRLASNHWIRPLLASFHGKSRRLGELWFYLKKFISQCVPF